MLYHFTPSQFDELWTAVAVAAAVLAWFGVIFAVRLAWKRRGSPWTSALVLTFYPVIAAAAATRLESGFIDLRMLVGAAVAGLAVFCTAYWRKEIAAVLLEDFAKADETAERITIARPEYSRRRRRHFRRNVRQAPLTKTTWRWI